MNVLPDVAVLDQPLLVRDPGALREADRGGRARVGDRHHEVGARPAPPRRAARPSARAPRARPCRRASSRAARSRRARRCTRRCGPAGRPARSGIRPRRPRRPRPGGRRGRRRRRRGRARTSRRRRPSRPRSGRASSGRMPSGIAERDERAVRDRDDRIRALEPAHRGRDGLGQRRRVAAEQRGDHLGVGRRAEPNAGGEELVAQRRRVDEVAVVRERDGARRAVVHERLRVRPVRAAGRRVARVADRDLAGQRRELLLVEHLRDEPHLAERRDAAAVGDRDPGGLLAAVLEREQAEVREPRDVALVRADAEDAAHQRAPLVRLRELGRARRRGARRRRRVPIRRTSTSAPVGSGSTSPAGQRDDHLAADLAEQRQRVVVEVELGAERRSRAPPRRARPRARPRRRRGRATRAAPARGRVPDERGLGREVERRRPAERPPARLRLRAGERERRARAGEQDRVALAPAARHASHVRDEADAADDGRRRDRPAVRVVVERDVPGDDRHAERLARERHALDRLRELPADLGLLRVAEVEAVGEAERLAAGARDVPRGLEDGELPRRAAGRAIRSGPGRRASRRARARPAAAGAPRRRGPGAGRCATGRAGRSGG